MATLICELCQQSFYKVDSDVRRFNVRFCSRTCYDQWRSSSENLDPAPRFWKKVNKNSGYIAPTLTTECWEWTAPLNPQGYGEFVVTTGYKQRENYLAHRFSWILQNGEIPNKLFVCHHCDNPKCVRPDHLFLGTNQENMQDASRKGRLNKSFPQPKLRKLTPEQVQELRSRYPDKGELLKDLALEYGLSRVTLRRIIIGEIYKDW